MGDKHFCPFEGAEAAECWIDQITSGVPEDKITVSREQVSSCARCEHLDAAVKRSVGRRSSDRLMSTAITRSLTVLSDYNRELGDMAVNLQMKVEELTVVKTVAEALLKASNLKDCLRIFLTGVTAGEAIGFNRAVLFLVNQQKRALEGQLAVGFADTEKYGETWSGISSTGLSFTEMIDRILAGEAEPVSDLTELVKKTYVPLVDEFGLLPMAVTKQETYILPRFGAEHFKSRRLLKIFEGHPGAIVPIISKETALGAVIVDNPVTGDEISAEDVSMLETLSYLAASKINNLILQNQLEIRVLELEHLHRLLQDNQKYLLETERLVEAGKLATTIAHEIKTPLVTIGGYSRRAIKSYERHEDISHDLKIMVDEISRLEDIAKNVLDYSGRRHLNLKSVDLNRLITETLEVLQDKFRMGNVDIDIIPSESTLKVKADRNRLKQVLYNLFDNAIHAMPGGGNLTVMTGSEGGYYWFSITDTGSGMSDEIIASMFEPFFTTREDGVGLGLSVSRRIIADHGGYMDVTSKPGTGSTFRVKLPPETTGDD